MRVSVITMLAVLCLCSAVAGQHVIVNSDLDNVMLCADLIRLGVQQGNRDDILMITTDELTVKDSVLDRRSYTALIDSVFRGMAGREMVASRPPEIVAAGFWDFSLDNLQAELRDDSCFVSCRLRLYASRTADGQPHETDETLVFVKHGKGWKLEKVSELFDFLAGGQ